ncbi:MAG: YiiX family permuted papain-like enzyme [FCB group bacterium]|nr:YiiX family permuted papain-like enzyme [FCB group bacterium]
MKRTILLLLSLVCLGCNSRGLKNGDIIFQVSKSNQSKAIQLATNSPYSHMGIVYIENDKAFVFEAVQPVKTTLLNEWITRGEDNHYVVKRLKKDLQILTPDVLNKMKKVGDQFMGKDYDLYFEWSDERIYCSELVWKIFKQGAGVEIGSLQKISEFDLSHPVVQQKIRERYNDQLPTEELVISPARMFNSDKLFTVVSK